MTKPSKYVFPHEDIIKLLRKIFISRIDVSLLKEINLCINGGTKIDPLLLQEVEYVLESSLQRVSLELGKKYPWLSNMIVDINMVALKKLLKSQEHKAYHNHANQFTLGGRVFSIGIISKELNPPDWYNPINGFMLWKAGEKLVEDSPLNPEDLA